MKGTVLKDTASENYLDFVGDNLAINLHQYSSNDRGAN